LATFHIIEMLYDTPYPTKTQTDHTPEKTNRNAEIIARYEAGKTGAIAVQEKDWKNEASLAYWKGDQAIPEASDAQRENTHQQRNRQ
jgi:hypothetical protein